MRKLLGILLLPVLLLSACGTAQTNENTDTLGTVENIFTNIEDTNNTGTDTSETGETSDNNEYEFMGGSHGFKGESCEDSNGTYRIYEGGEMEMTYGLNLTGTEGKGYAIEFFLDGQPQPYRVEGGDGDGSEDYAYIHTFYPEDDVELLFTLYFVPVTGEEGDMLNLWAVNIWNPTYFWDEEIGAAYQVGMGSTSARTRILFNASPDNAPDVEDASDLLLSWDIEMVDTTEDEIAGWTTADLATKLKYTLYANGSESSVLYGTTNERTLKVVFTAWGNQYIDFSFVLFIDHKPVLVDGRAFDFDLENGQKAVITVEIDLSYFDGESIAYCYLVPRNYAEVRALELQGDAYFEALKTFYLTGAEDYIELFGWEETAGE